MLQENLIKMLRANEGVRTKTYKCTQGFDTIGVGYNLERPDARSTITAMGIDYDALRAGKIALTSAQIDALLQKDLVAVLDDVKVLFKNFDTMPEKAQLVICDMRYQLGAAGLRGFKNTVKALSQGNWAVAARGLRNSLAYKQTPVRWERNANSLESLI